MKNYIVRTFLKGRVQRINSYTNNAHSLQKKQLKKLLTTAKDTLFGKTFEFEKIHSYKEFSEKVPLQSYEQIQPWIGKMLRGEDNILWPGKIKYFAQSSGTSDAKSKYIPISEETFEHCHYKGGLDAVALYLQMNPNSRFFSGKGLILGAGAPEMMNKNKVGLLSGLLVEHANPLLNLIRTPSLKMAMIRDFSEKIEEILPVILRKNITNISGIPSWYQVLFQTIKDKTGEEDISNIWPNLEVFFHGGVSFEPYKDFFRSAITSKNMHYMEMYNASEGFFAMQNDFADRGMLLMLDYGIFYEFIPFEEENNKEKVLTLEDVELGKPYEMIISNNSGLWRYRIGDVVEFTSLQPYKIIISGRTKHYLNLCGEEVMVDNANRAIMKAAEETNAKISDYTATVCVANAKQKAHHQYLIEFLQPPTSIKLFGKVLDETLCAINSDYESKRINNIALGKPEVIVAKKGLFIEWMKKNNKMGGQQKVPRLLQHRGIMDELLQMNKI